MLRIAAFICLRMDHYAVFKSTVLPHNLSTRFLVKKKQSFETFTERPLQVSQMHANLVDNCIVLKGTAPYYRIIC
jgi:hypothetical protein